jgi:hypothetical protein
MKKTITLLYFSLIVFLQIQGQNVGDFRSVATGNWNTTTSWQTWNGSAWVAASSLPVNTSAVNIQSGNTITINTTGLASGPLTVNGTLTYIPTAAAGLTVTGSVDVTPTGSFTSPVSGTIVTSTLSISANLQVDGNFNMNTFSTAGVITTFIGAANDSIYGSGATVKFYSLTVNKGTSTANVLEVISSRVISIAAPTATGSRLTLTNGTFKLSSASALTPYFGTQTLYTTNSRLWLNNAGASVSSVNVGLVAGTGNMTLSGTIEIAAGTFSYGSGSDIITINKVLILEGPNATFNTYGNLTIGTNSTLTQSAGKINIYPQAGNSLISTDALIFNSSSSLTNWTITGGQITIVDPPASTSTHTAFITNISSGTINVSGMTLRFGDGTSDKAGGTNGFLVAGTLPVGNVIVNNSSSSVSTSRIVKLNNAFTAVNLTVNSGAANQFLLNGFVFILSGNVTNSGTFNGNDAAASGINFNGSAGQVVSGTGSFTGSTIRNITVNNTSGLTPAVDLHVNLTVSAALTLTNGVLGSSNVSLLTIGNSASSATFTLTRSGGSLQSLPAFSFGGVTAINYSYTAPSPASSTITGFELPATTPLTTFTVNNSSGVILDKAVSATTLALTNGILTTTSANSVTVLGTSPTNLTGGSATAYVNGPLTLTIPNNAGSANYKFQIGKTSYHLAQYAFITTGGSGTGTFTLEAFDAGSYPGTAGLDMASVNTDNYFQLTTNLGGVIVSASQLSITQTTGLTSTSRIAQSNAVNGSFDDRGGGTIVSNTITSTLPLDYSSSSTGTFFRIGTVSASSFSAGIYAIGPNGPYEGYAATFTTLQNAANALMDNTPNGNVIFEFQPDYVPSVEVYPVILPPIASGTSTATVTFRPAPNVSSVINISNDGLVISNIGAQYYTFDGRAGGLGSGLLLQFTNTATTGEATAISIVGNAIYNQFLYCTLKGSSSAGATGYGIINIGNTSIPYSAEDGNYTIDHCNFDGSGAAPSGFRVDLTASNGTITNNNFFNYLKGGGIYINAGIGVANTVIQNNNFYQTVPYTGVNGTAYGIYLLYATSSTVSNNFVGGSGPGATGTWTVSNTTPAAFNFVGIYEGCDPNSNVFNNTIQNFNWNVSSGTSWTGLQDVGYGDHIGTNGANIIGSRTGNDNIKVTANSAGTITLIGLYAASGGTQTGSFAQNNIIGALTTGQTVTGVNSNLYGLETTSVKTIQNNKIGSTTTTNSLNASTTGTNNVYGIYAPGGAPTISNDSISNLNSTGAGNMDGIYFSGTTTVSSNVIFNLTISGAAATATGIYDASGGATANTITGNVIYNLSNTGTGSTMITGINGAFTDMIAKNLIHSFSTTSNTAVQNGIKVSNGSGTIQNNAIRLGIDGTGASVTSTAQINGIWVAPPTAGGPNPFACYNNTVYIGGSGVVAGTVKCYDFFLNNHGLFYGSYSENIRDNIFVDVRTNAVPNLLNYSVSLPAYSITIPFMEDYNIYQVSSTDGKLANVGGTDRNNLGAIGEVYQGADTHSGFGNPLLTNPTGSAGILSLAPANSSPAEGTGILISTVTDDINDLLRSANTPTDIGAYAGNFTAPGASQDIFPPVITYAPLGNTSLITNRTTSNFATTTDFFTGVNTTPGNKPRLYYKLSTDANVFGGNTSSDNGWKWVESFSGTSPFDFTIDYSIINGGSVSLGSIIQYFVVAQDLATVPNVSFKPSTGASGISVASTGMIAPTTPNSYTIVTAIPVAVDVGTGYPYTTLTGAGGLFAAINAGVLSSNTVATIHTDMVEPGTVALNLVSEQGSNAGTLTLTIKPDASAHLISGTAVATGAPMIPIAGAVRLIIDGGASKLLTFRNSKTTASQTGPVIQFNNNSSSDTVRNCNIESNSTSTSLGEIFVGTTGTNNVAIINNEIRKSNGGTLGSPVVGIYSNNPTNFLTITGNDIYDWSGSTCYGIYLGSGASGMTISGNSFFMETGVNSTGTQTSIYVSGCPNVTVQNNFIGGTQTACGGNAWSNGGSQYFYGINIASGTGTVQSNTIKNITFTFSETFIGIENTGGVVNIIGNTIGNTTTSNSISIPYVGGYILYGLVSPGIVTNFDQNVIQNIAFGSNVNGTFSAIYSSGGNIRRNKITGITYAGTSNVPTLIGINVESSAATNEISNNEIAFDGTNSAVIYGFQMGSNYTGTNIFYYNSINIYGTATGSASSMAFYRNYSSQPFDAKNNIFANSRSGGTGPQFAVYNAYDAANFHSDYNDLYTTGTVLGSWLASDVANFAAWQALGTDAHSKNTMPAFTSNSNLYIVSDPNLANMGTPVSVTIDIDGVTRSSLPDMGINQFGLGSKVVTLTAYLEGLYAGSGTMNTAMDYNGASFVPKWGAGIADHVTIELHSSSGYATLVTSVANVALSTSGTVTFNLPATYNGNYYVTILHRNSLATVSAVPVSFSSATPQYDFSTSAAQAYGGNLKNIGGVYCIYTGDVSSSGYPYPGTAVQDGVVDLNDLYYIYASYLNGDLGYLPGDINGDGVVDITDVYMAYANYLLGVYEITPP